MRRYGPINIRILFPNQSNAKNNTETHHMEMNKYVAFVSGTLLAISESLPFFDNVNSNGLLHAASGIMKNTNKKDDGDMKNEDLNI